jgi:protoporphyrin/coproporphyrin ferrochelatase
MAGYDAFLLVSFGGPEGPEDVIPFLQNVTAGRNVPLERLEQVAEHYYRFGGVSPINQQCRELAAAVEKDFAARGVPLPVYWGNRNWDPYLADTLAEMADAGVSRALAFVTSAYSSFSSCRQYLGDIEAARQQVGQSAPQVDKIRQYFNHPGFIASFAAAAAQAVDALSGDSLPGDSLSGDSLAGDDFDLIFTAHSIPVSMAEASGPVGGAYQAQLAEAARLVAAEIGYQRPWHLAYTSRSGPPAQPWLEPDINDLLAERAAAGSRAVVIVPIGFVSDHMEVKFDLDIEAAQTADRLGLKLARAATPGTDHSFVSMITDLVCERLDGTTPLTLGALGAGHDICPAGCCGGAPVRPAAR